MRFLKQSTAVEVPIGPFVDATDAVTAETALTISQADVRLKKNAGDWAQKAETTAAAHEENGCYRCLLDTTDTDTLGLLRLHVAEAGALPVWEDFMVMPANVYDSLFSTDKLQVDAVEISSDATAADNLETALDDTAGAVPWFGIVDQGTAQAATATTIQLRAAASLADDTANGMTVAAFGSTQGYWQTRAITDYVSATDTATVDAWTVTPSGTITYKVFMTPPGVDAAAIRSALGMASANLDTQLSTIDTVVDAVKAKTDSLTFTQAGHVDANVQRINDVAITGDGSGTPFNV